MPLSPADKKRVDDLVRNRLELCLVLGDSGFAVEQSHLVQLGEVELDGVELDGHDNTKPTRSASATVTCYLTVDETCCNPSGNAHGGFFAWLVDHCSSLAVLALSGPGEKWVTSGVSTNLQLYYTGAAPVGTKLRIVNKVLQQGRVTTLTETRILDDATGKLLVLGTHVKQDPQRRSKL
ncbi:PaaI family thioesterase [Rhodotorula paludigena]|uniref:PaaI family thioesterase n=1 Tax=Rhodotorula paludigena TaxID=86838 RepID=UPI0031827E5C